MLRALLLLIALTACVNTGGTVTRAEHTQIAGRYTAEYLLSDHPHHVLMGRILMMERADEAARALVIEQRLDGVHRLLMHEAWSHGQQLPYARLDQHAACGLTCRNRAVGMIPLSQAMIMRGAEAGFSARLLGRQGPIDIFVPPALFQEALGMG